MNATAIITGASSGIGADYARYLASLGYNLIITARRKNKLLHLSNEITKTYNVTVEIEPLDIGNKTDLFILYKKINQLKNIEVLVHAAGFSTTGFFEQSDPEIMEQQIYLHDISATLLTRAVLPEMTNRNKGYIILISSMASFMTTLDFTLYSSTKLFLNMLATGLRDELAGTDVKILSVCPGAVKTPFWDTEYFKDSKYAAIPKAFWITTGDVIKESWHHIQKKNSPVMIPGYKNRLFINFLNIPVTGYATKLFLGYLARKNIKNQRKKLIKMSFK